MAIRNVTRAGVGLVVGIIILGLLVLGGLWLVRERGEQARRAEAINIAEQQLQSDSDQEVAIDTEDATEKETDTPPVKEEESAPAPAPVTPTTPTEATKPEGQTAAPAPSAQPEEATVLPQTGPDAFSILGLGILSFAVLSYIHSRKLL